MIVERHRDIRPHTILVVEDEVLIRLAVAEGLRDCGYHVLEASNAADAIVVLNSGTPVDLVFTDVQMPGERDGLDLARWVRRNRPEARILITSGRTLTSDLGDDLGDLGPVQAKPFAQQALLRRIQGLLAGSPV